MPDIRILIVAVDPLARAGLAALLAEQPGIAVVGRVSNADELPAAVNVHKPDVLLWDQGWNPQPELERLADLVETLPPAVVLLPDGTAAADAWTAGARGLLLRDAEPPRIVAALQALAHGLAALDPTLAAALQEAGEPRPSQPWTIPETPSLIEPLTPRELEVLRLLADGLPNKTIAGRLAISEHTVKFHINAILGKLGVASRTEAVVRATRLGLILL